jgi:hypothetical protein
MIVKKAIKAAVFILSFSLLALSACGELSTPLLSSGGTYQIRALVNGNSLESCSLIRKDDKIVPYFAISVVNDPDLMGLLVYLQNSQGDIVGDKALYTIYPVENAEQDETQTEEAEEPEDVSSAEEAEAETAEQTEPLFPEQVMEKQASIETRPSIKIYDTVIQVKSFEQEMPSFPLPKNLEIGPYILIFETVDSRYNTLSITESDIFYLGSVEFKLNDISMYLPSPSDASLIPPGAVVMLEAGLDFDSQLNPYVIWYSGRNIISQGIVSEGAGNILWKAPEQPGFYSLRLEVLPYQLKRNFTGIYREITLPVSAKASLTGYFFGNGPDFPAKRPLAAGTAYAEQVAAARAAASAAADEENADKNVIAPIMPEYPELLRWYRFDGDFEDKSLIPDLAFETSSEKNSRWAAVAQNYGFSVGPDDNYLLRPIRFVRQGEEEGGGIFLFHIRPATEETVFSAFFPLLATASNGVWMEMATRENAITLRLKTRDASVEIPVNKGYLPEQGFIPIVVEFYIRPYRFEAKLSLGENLSIQSMAGEIKLPSALTGEGRIRLGVDKTTPGSALASKSVLVSPNLTDSETGEGLIETAQPENADNENKTQPVITVATVWDEFAVLYSTIPLLSEEIFIEEIPEAEEPQAEKEAVKPLPASAAPANANPADSRPANTTPPDMAAIPLENETPLADIQPENILIEQEPAEAETEDEEAPLLISVQ